MQTGITKGECTSLTDAKKIYSLEPAMLLKVAHRCIDVFLDVHTYIVFAIRLTDLAPVKYVNTMALFYYSLHQGMIRMKIDDTGLIDV
jgi:hypothetical protein